MQPPSKGTLARILSKLQGFSLAKVSLEQYETPSEVAAEIISLATQLGDITNKRILDLGSGTGTLGLGTMFMGAKTVTFIEKDLTALNIAELNLKNLKSEYSLAIPASFKNIDVVDLTNEDSEIKENIDTIFQNPPFGTKTAHADRTFLTQACKLCQVIYTCHKTSTDAFVRAFAKDNNYSITHAWRMQFALKQTMKFHTRNIQRIDVTWYRMKKSPDSFSRR